LFDELRRLFKAGPDVEFHGTYPIEPDCLVATKERVQMIAQEIWQLTGYRFTWVNRIEYRFIKTYITPVLKITNLQKVAIGRVFGVAKMKVVKRRQNHHKNPTLDIANTSE